MIADLGPLIEKLVIKVFATMLQMKAVVAPDGNEIAPQCPHVAGSIGFSGSTNGVIHFMCTESFARKVACTMLGMADWQLEGNEMADDVIGEITNMIAGNVASELRNRGHAASISIPTIVRGSNFTIRNISGCKCFRFHFLCEGTYMNVDLVLKE